MITNTSALLSSEAIIHLSSISIQQMSDPVFWVKSNASFIYANDAARKIIGYSLAEICSMKVFDINSVYTGSTWESYWKEVKEKGFHKFETVIKTKAAFLIPVEILVNHIEFQGEEYHCTFVSDLSIKKKWEMEKRKEAETKKLEEEKLLQADKMISLGVLVAGIAHEINNPNSSIMLNIGVFQKAWKNILPILNDYHEKHPDLLIAGIPFQNMKKNIPVLLSSIQDSSNRIKTIANDLRDYSTKTDLSGSFLPVDVNDALKTAISLTQQLINKSCKNFSVSFASNLPKVKGIKQNLEQVLVNLISNACQALKCSQDAIDIQSRADIERNRVIITISDTGMGIELDKLKSLTEPFFSTKQTEGGTGLGLYVADKIIKNHRGKLILSSQPNQGFTARIILPSSNIS